MIKTSLFADQERIAKLDKLGDALWVMEQHVDFAALAAEVGPASQQRAQRGSTVSNRVDGKRASDPAIAQLERRADGISTARVTQFPAFRRPACQSIFEAVNKQLSKQSYIARGGQMIDARAPRIKQN